MASTMLTAASGAAADASERVLSAVNDFSSMKSRITGPVLNDAASAALAEAANTIQHHMRTKLRRKELQKKASGHGVAALRESLFNRDARSVWWLPRKPTRLYILDVIARAQTVSFAKARHVLIPSGHWRPLWGLCLLGVATADFVSCLFSLAFCHRPSYQMINHVARGLLIVDMILSFISAFPTTRGTLEMRPRHIARAYLRGGFIIDLLAMIPLEVWVDPAPPRHMLSWQLFHAPRWFLRWLYWDDFRSITTTSNNGAMQIFKYLLLMLMVAHMSGCLYYYASAMPRICEESSPIVISLNRSQIAIEEHNAFDLGTWSLIPVGDSAEGNSYRLYVFYLFAAFRVLLGDASSAFNADTWLLSIGIMIAGNVMFAVVFGEVLLAISALKRSSDMYAERMQSVNESMAHDRIPERLQRRIRRFFEFSWLAVHGDTTDAQGYLSDLPSGLRIAVSLSLFGQLLKQVPLFKACNGNVIALLAQRLVMVMYMPDEVILKEGTNGDSMYFIQGGAVYIVQKETILGELKPGSFFGEVALTSARGARRTASVLSKTVTTLQQLSRQDLEEVALDEPGVLVLIRQTAIRRRRELGEEIRALKDTAFSVLVRQKSSSNLAKTLRERALARKDSLKVHPETQPTNPFHRRKSSLKILGKATIATQKLEKSRRQRLAGLLARFSSRVKVLTRLGGGRGVSGEATPSTATSSIASPTARAEAQETRRRSLAAVPGGTHTRIDISSGLPLGETESILGSAVACAIHQRNPEDAPLATPPARAKLNGTPVQPLSPPSARAPRLYGSPVNTFACTDEGITGSGEKGEVTQMDELLHLVRTMSTEVQAISLRQNEIERQLTEGMGETRARVAAALRSSVKPRRY